MSQLQPVPAPYDPKYPRQLTDEEVEKLLRPGLFSRFSRETLLSGALLAGLSLGAAGQDQKPALGKAELEDARAKAMALARETLGGYPHKGWNGASSIALGKVLASNPGVKYPLIPISFGNSYVGIFDTKKATEVTTKLFEIYGIKLQPGQNVAGEGFAFEADGWNAESKIGFRLITPEEQREKAKAKNPERALEAHEVAPLGAAVASGKLRMFVVEAGKFPNMDGDLYTPMEYYLSSVIDYLNWALGGAEIDPEKVLDRKPTPRPR